MYQYLGAYLEIKIAKVKTERRVKSCINKHVSYGNYPFCPQCGGIIIEKKEIVEEYPVRFSEILEDFEDDDELHLIEFLEKSSSIIAKSNIMKILQTTEWVDLDPYDGRVMTKEFPTQKEIEAMKVALSKSHQDTIKKLTASPLVKKVTIKAGYVYDGG